MHSNTEGHTHIDRYTPWQAPLQLGWSPQTEHRYRCVRARETEQKICKNETQKTTQQKNTEQEEEIIGV